MQHHENVPAIGASTQIAGTGASWRQVPGEVQRGKLRNGVAPCEQPHEEKPLVYAQHEGAKMTSTEF